MANISVVSLEDIQHEGACPECGEEFKFLRTHLNRSDCESPTAIDAESFALFSGGHDSLVSTHYSMEELDVDCVLHIDTNTGIPETQEYVKDVCREFDWDLEIRQTEMTLEEFAKEWGFPKQNSHSVAYRHFKERALRTAASDSKGGKPDFYSGVRKDESQRRMQNVSTEPKETDRWVWRSPIADWTKDDCEEYIEEHDLPRNPVVDNIHESGECFCGAFDKRDEKLIDLQAHYPDHYEWLMEVEQEVQEVQGREEPYCWWGSSGVSSEELQCLIEQGDHDEDMVLCQDCVSESDTVLDF